MSKSNRRREAAIRARAGRPLLPHSTQLGRTILGLGCALVLGGTAIPQALAQNSMEMVRNLSIDEVPSLSFSGNFLAAQHARRTKDISRAAEYYRRALEVDPENVVLRERAFALLVADGQIKAGMELAHKLDDGDSSNRLAHLTIGIEALRKGESEKAVEKFERKTLGPLDKLTSGLMAAWALQALGKTDQALKSIDALSGMEWFAVYKTYHSGLIAGQAGRKKDALRHLAKAYKLDSGAMRIVTGYAMALAVSGDREAARAIISKHSSAGGPHPILADVLRKIDAKQPPQPQITDPLAGAAEVLYGLGAAISRDGGEEMSAIYLQLALHLHEEGDLAKIVLSGLYEKLRQFDKSIEVLERIGGHSPLFSNARIQMALNYNALDNVEEARSQLRRLLDEDPKNINAIRALGNVLRVRKFFEEAAEIYSMGIKAIGTPNRADWGMFYYRGICYERTKKWDLAEADFLKALEIFPEQPLVLNYLGYSWVDMNQNLKTALDMIERAVEKRPNDGYIVDSLGWAYYRLGRYEDAARELERAVLLRPNDPVINDHLGDAYWRVGRRLEARFQWSHARDMEPEADVLKKITEKLTKGLGDPKPDATATNGEKDG